MPSKHAKPTRAGQRIALGVNTEGDVQIDNLPLDAIALLTMFGAGHPCNLSPYPASRHQRRLWATAAHTGRACPSGRLQGQLLRLGAASPVADPDPQIGDHGLHASATSASATGIAYCVAAAAAAGAHLGILPRRWAAIVKHFAPPSAHLDLPHPEFVAHPADAAGPYGSAEGGLVYAAELRGSGKGDRHGGAYRGVVAGAPWCG